MIGGRIIENAPHVIDGAAVRRLWCMDRNGDECAVFAELGAEALQPGEEIWWQSGRIYARADRVTFKKIGYSFDPARTTEKKDG